MKGIKNLFRNRTMIIATMHGKNKVIAPIMEQGLGVKPYTPSDFNTDTLGTFTGEIERKDDPVTTLRKKCLWAMEMYQIDLGIASEGSFGPHPLLFGVHADEEWVMMIDKMNDLEIIERQLSIETNFSGNEIKSEQALRSFADKAFFPSHRLVVRNEKNGNKKIIKGIGEWEELLSSYHDVSKTFGSAFVETDMRAMFNPSRMNVIALAAKKIVDRSNSLCPICETPGFGITGHNSGLTCELCKSPTRSTLELEYSCNCCGFSMKEKYPHGKFFEEPMYCDVCNP
ncbi:MAG: DUF6671 family protein [bacterium]|jgi:hypothetical protein